VTSKRWTQRDGIEETLAFLKSKPGRPICGLLCGLNREILQLQLAMNPGPLAGFHPQSGARVSVVVKALCYKPKGRGYEFFNLPKPSGHTSQWYLLSL
jgi:hypothetical protein